MMAGQWQVSRQWPAKKKRVSSTGVSLTGDLPRTRAMVPFLAPYARGGWHWFSLRATLAVLSILVGLATPALAAALGRVRRRGLASGSRKGRCVADASPNDPRR